MSDVLRHTDRVAAALAQRILSGNWSENEKFPADTALCAEFDVSRTVIREALRLLSAKGLIIAVPRRGTHVAMRENWALWDKDVLNWLSKTDISNNKYDFSADALDMRLALEPTLAALAASRADEPANKALQDTLQQLQQDAHKDTYKDAHARFLACFYGAAQNAFALAALPLAAYSVAHKATPPPLDAYRRLTAAIAQKDGATARQAALQALLSD
ncbi:MAG: GntR family transcriptional regulator [Alphaproteobacteria bacterium]|nr:GntR family transcriptional regulator [Alphaproteobacteria bacterium]